MANLTNSIKMQQIISAEQIVIDGLKRKGLIPSDDRIEDVNVVIKKKKPEGFIELFVDRIINGDIGFKIMEDREFAIYPDREVGIAEFVIRCLANKDCEGSEEIVNAIIKRRTK